MERKIIKIGNSSVVVSLPKKWVEKAKVARGASVEVGELATGELIISPKKVEVKKKLVEIDASRGYVGRRLVQGYINGGDTFTIVSPDSNTLDEIYANLNDLPGLEIIEADAKKIVLEYYGGKAPLLGLLNRFSVIVSNYISAAALAFKDGRRANLETLRKFREINKLYHAILRSLIIASGDTKSASEMGIESHDLIYYSLLASNFKEMARTIEKIEYYETGFNDTISKLFENMLKAHKKSMSAFSRRDSIAAFEAFDEVTGLLKEVPLYSEKFEDKQAKKGFLLVEDELHSKMSMVRDAVFSEKRYLRELFDAIKLVLKYMESNLEIIALKCTK